MLNRTRTSNIMISKYLMFIPVVALLLLFSNCANNKSEQDKAAVETTETAPTVAPENATEPKAETNVTENKDDSEVFNVVEHMPEYPGGMKELMKFLSSTIKYPANAEKNKIEGRVIVEFVVNKDGSLSDIKVVRGVDPELDAEALRVINAMPKWKPGMNKGEPVRVKFTVPVMYRLK